MDNFPRVTIQIHPRCNHREFHYGCVYCMDAQKVYFSILKLQEETKNKLTKLQILGAEYKVEEL